MLGKTADRVLWALIVAGTFLFFPVTAAAQYVIGPGPGGTAPIQFVEPGGTRTIVAFPGFLGGVSVTLGDVNGDGVADVIAGAGPGGTPHVKVFNGTDLSELASFFAFDPGFTGGVHVAAGDIDGDGRADIIVAAGPGGGPQVRVLSGANLSELASFWAYDPAFDGGVSVAAGDVDGDGRSDIIIGAGPGGGPHVRVLSGLDLSELASFFAYDPAFQGGVNVAAGDLDGDGSSDIVTSAGRGGGPHVRVFSGADLSELASFFAFDPEFGGGVTVATGDLDGDGRVDLILGALDLHVRILSGVDLSEIDSFVTPPEFGAGISVGSIGDPPGVRFTSPATTAFRVGSAGTFTVTTAGGPVPAITRSGPLPTGVTFTDNGDRTATLAGTPAAGTGGSYALTFTADNGIGTPKTQTFTLTVNQAPAITSAAATTFSIGAAGTFAVTTAGFPRPAITRTGTALPGGVTWVDNGDGTGTLGGTPAAGTAGTYAITFTADNGTSPAATQSFTLTVSGAPTFTSANTTTFTVGTLGTFTITAIGSPTPAIAASGTLPPGVNFVDNGNGTATLSGTPAAGTGGSYALTFTASNGVLPNATQAFTLIVNQAPAVTSAAGATFTVGSAGSFTITTSGLPLPTLARGGVALPAGVQFVDNGNGTGTLSGTPGAGTGGTYAISFTATNSVGSSAPQAFTLTVNQAPAFTSAVGTAFTVGAAGTFSITTTGSPAVTTITRGGAALPAGVNFTDNGNGTATLAGTPAAGTGGTYALTFTINNGVGGNVVQNFTLSVNAPPAITSANSTTFTVGTLGTFTVSTTGFPAPTVSQTGALPTGVTFTTPTLTGTATQTGAFPLVFTATNAIPPDATQNFTLNVVCPAITVNPAGALADGLYQVAYGGATFTQTGSTGSTITWSATGLPAGLAIGAATGVVSGTPTNTVLNAAVNVTATDNFGCTGTRATTINVRPVATNDSFTGGVGNTQFVVGASVTTPAVVKAGNVKGNDNGPGVLTVTFNPPASGTVAEGATDGTFIYTPNVAFGGPTDTFTYTLTDGNGVTNTGTVTIALSGMVWYVSSGPTNGDGRSHSPFNTLANAAAPSGGGSQIYVHTGTGTTTGSLAMDASQTLHGAGAAFALNDLAIGAGTAPTLSGTVTLANNGIVRAVTFSGASPAMTATNALTAPVTIDQVSVTGGTTALSLTNVSGAVTVNSNSSFINTSAAEVLISQGTGNVTIAAPISSNAGRAIDIQSRTSGTVTFTGAITDTGGTGILLNNNGTSTFIFSGGLTLNGTGTTFTATNPSLTGTLTITGTNTIGATTPPTSGTALNATNINIGASGLTFRSVSANGVTNGIVLSNTGTSGGLTVTGNGGTCTSAMPTCTGGRIQNTTGADNSTATPPGTGIVLNNTRSVSLTLMRIDNHSNYAIRGTEVTGFSLTNSIIDGLNGTNVATPFNDGSLSFIGTPSTGFGLSGDVAILDNEITGGRQRNVSIDNATGTMNLNFLRNLVHHTQPSPNGDDGLAIEVDTSAVMFANISNNTFTAHGGDHFNLSLVNNANADLTFANNDLNGGFAGALGQGLFILGASYNGTFKYDISGNDVQGNVQGGAIFVNKGSGTGTFSGRIINNVVGTSGVTGSGSAQAVGIHASARGAGGSHTTLINNNQVYQYFDRGIVLEAGEGSPALTATLTNNTVANFADATNSLHGIHFDFGILSTDNAQITVDVRNNLIANAGNEPQGGVDFRMRTAGSNDTFIAGYSGGNNSANAQAFIDGQNPDGTTFSVTQAASGTYNNGPAVPLPTPALPTLPPGP